MAQKKLHFTLMLLISLSLYACTYIVSLKAMNQKEVKVDRIVYDDKRIVLVSMTHFGEPQFYVSLTDSIKHWKHEGYRVYYEGLKTKAHEMNVDSILADITFRKFRHLRGGEMADSSYYAQLKATFNSKMVQPDFKELGADSTDLNADISLITFIKEYEKRYGEIQLLSCDWATPIGRPYTCKKPTEKDLTPITIDYRNQHLVDLIRHSDDRKIVVIYGARHITGIRQLLQ